MNLFFECEYRTKLF